MERLPLPNRPLVAGVAGRNTGAEDLGPVDIVRQPNPYGGKAQNAHE